VFLTGDRVVVSAGAFAGLAGVVVGLAGFVAAEGSSELTCRVRLRLWREHLTVDLPCDRVRVTGQEAE
jgi:hypothetical protein